MAKASPITSVRKSLTQAVASQLIALNLVASAWWSSPGAAFAQQFGQSYYSQNRSLVATPSPVPTGAATPAFPGQSDAQLMAVARLMQQQGRIAQAERIMKELERRNSLGMQFQPQYSQQPASMAPQYSGPMPGQSQPSMYTVWQNNPGGTPSYGPPAAPAAPEMYAAQYSAPPSAAMQQPKSFGTVSSETGFAGQQLPPSGVAAENLGARQEKNSSNGAQASTQSQSTATETAPQGWRVAVTPLPPGWVQAAGQSATQMPSEVFTPLSPPQMPMRATALQPTLANGDGKAGSRLAEPIGMTEDLQVQSVVNRSPANRTSGNRPAPGNAEAGHAMAVENTGEDAPGFAPTASPPSASNRPSANQPLLGAQPAPDTIHPWQGTVVPKPLPIEEQPRSHAEPDRERQPGTPPTPAPLPPVEPVRVDEFEAARAATDALSRETARIRIIPGHRLSAAGSGDREDARPSRPEERHDTSGSRRWRPATLPTEPEASAAPKPLPQTLLGEERDIRLVSGNERIPPPTPPPAKPSSQDGAFNLGAALRSQEFRDVHAPQVLQGLELLNEREARHRALGAMRIASAGVDARTAIPILRKLLAVEADSVVKLRLSEAILKTQPNDRDAIDCLASLLSDRSTWELRQYAACALSAAAPGRDAVAIVRLTEALDDANPRVRSMAALSLAQFKGGALEAVPRLRVAASTDVPRVQQAAAAALVAITGNRQVAKISDAETSGDRHDPQTPTAILSHPTEQAYGHSGDNREREYDPAPKLLPWEPSAAAPAPQTRNSDSPDHQPLQPPPGDWDDAGRVDPRPRVSVRLYRTEPPPGNWGDAPPARRAQTAASVPPGNWGDAPRDSGQRTFQSKQASAGNWPNAPQPSRVANAIYNPAPSLRESRPGQRQPPETAKGPEATKKVAGAVINLEVETGAKKASDHQ